MAAKVTYYFMAEGRQPSNVFHQAFADQYLIWLKRNGQNSQFRRGFCTIRICVNGHNIADD
jgi:hypothetical protein